MDYSCYINVKTVKKPLDIECVEVEIGFGRGDFIVKVAKERPEKTFIGFEITEVSIKKLLKRVNREGIKNIKCVWIDAFFGFQLLFKDRQVKQIYINYPDPFPKKRDVNRRITRKESLYVLSKKLDTGCYIDIRTDHFGFLEYTLEQAKQLECFNISYRELKVNEPVTKYEEKWMKMGKKLYHIRLKKVKEPVFTEFRRIKEVKMLFPVKLKNIVPNPKILEETEHKIRNGLNARFYKVWNRSGNFLIEAIVSENGFVQKFMIIIKRKGNSYIFDISPFSDVLKTKGVQEVVNFVAKESIR